jgi:hypothetical protein
MSNCLLLGYHRITLLTGRDVPPLPPILQITCFHEVAGFCAQIFGNRIVIGKILIRKQLEGKIDPFVDPFKGLSRGSGDDLIRIRRT